MSKYVECSPEVKTALEEGKPVVALESTIITHGMPYPENIETAKKVEEIIKERGVVPATIALMDGKIKVGLTAEELEMLAKADDVVKVSRRDIASVLAEKLYGATTVAATMICAEAAGIKVFVTGGIGGVHRNGETTMDISADLQELSKTNVAVICAGAKSILDIGLTLEYLETYGVPVIGYKTNEFPAFYTRESGFETGLSADSAKKIAEAMRIKWELNLQGGIVVGNPVPQEDALSKEWIDQLITESLEAAEQEGIRGKDTTPFLLDRLKEVSQGSTLKTNIALVENNAKVGADIAAAYYKN
ncbi:pseudouridine-5'-phosphate glycosidase [Alkalicoccus daliensis]|uniref:pseudouridine-5'-phosphate glycosidase n=1 Tax=Alkalicoccus daliensis TaxID=745820 RepID=UPI003CC7B094